MSTFLGGFFIGYYACGLTFTLLLWREERRRR